MGKKKKTLDPEKREVVEEKVKSRRRKQRVVVSRFFQDAAATPQNEEGSISIGGCRKRLRRGKRSQGEAGSAVVVSSRFFPQDQDGGPTTKRSGEESPERVVVSRFFRDPAAVRQSQGCCTSGTRKRRRGKGSREEEPEIVVSRFFQDRELGKGRDGGRIAAIEGPKASATGKRVEGLNKKKEGVVCLFPQSRELSLCKEGGHPSGPVVEIAEIGGPKASETETRREESDTNKERVTGKSREPEVSLKLRRCQEGGHQRHPVVEIAEIDGPKASATETRREESDVKKERVVSRFFQNPQPGLDSTGITDIDELFSRFAYKGACDVPGSISIERLHSPNFRKRSVKSDSGPSTPARVERVAVSKATVGKPKKKKKDIRNTLLRAADKKKEAYRRKDSDNPWKPPRTVHRLLQEDHAHDPWRVLVICMLLNLTTGKQTGQILENLFSEFPDAKAAADAPEERLQEIIKTLGLHKKRSSMIKRMSQEYLDEGWTHVTELHGVGKYAADAYAIFCTGRWYDVTPVDHKLKDYWDYLCANEDRFR